VVNYGCLEDVTICRSGYEQHRPGAAESSKSQTKQWNNHVPDYAAGWNNLGVPRRPIRRSLLVTLSADGRDRLDVGIARSSRANTRFDFGKAETNDTLRLYS